MNIIFFGSSKYSVIVAKAVHKQFGLQLVVTKPGPVVEFSEKNNIPVITTNKLTDDVISVIVRNKPDFLVVADYGLIIPKVLLSLPKYVPLNVHHSLLPKYRGTTPAPSAILAGEKITGVTIIKMAEKVDSGDILAQKEYKTKPDETTDSLLTQLNILGAEILIPAIENFQEAIEHARKQDESKATYTPRLTKESGYISLNQESIMNYELLDRMMRAYYPWPSVWTRYNLSSSNQQSLKIIKLLPNHMIQVEGKKPMNYKDFMNGYPKGRELLGKLGLI